MDHDRVVVVVAVLGAVGVTTVAHVPLLVLAHRVVDPGLVGPSAEQFDRELDRGREQEPVVEERRHRASP